MDMYIYLVNVLIWLIECIGTVDAKTPDPTISSIVQYQVSLIIDN